MTRPGNTTQALDTFRSISVSKKWHDGKVYYVVDNLQYARAHVIPFNPKTVLQQSNRTKFAQAVTAWAGLTQAEKEVFNNYARLLDLQMSGYNFFIKSFMLA